MALEYSKETKAWRSSPGFYTTEGLQGDEIRGGDGPALLQSSHHLPLGWDKGNSFHKTRSKEADRQTADWGLFYFDVYVILILIQVIW